MAWSRDKVNSSNINNGNEYVKGDRVSRQALNSMVNSGLYSQDFVEALADTPIVENDETGASPSVELVDNVKNGKTYKKFKFKNLANAKLYDSTGENIDGAMTQKATTDELNKKVGKVEGKSLIADSEISRLANVTNYDDTALSNRVSQNESNIDDLSNDKVDKSTTVNGKALTSNITLSASDVSALPNTTKYATDLSIVMNSSSYTINIQLKDQDGNSIGATRGIDLPLESVVVSGNYDDTTKEVVLVLKNGSEVRFSVADLVDGLANQTDLDTTNTNISNLTTRVTNTETKNTEQDTAISNKVDKTTTVNGKALSSNINITKTDVGLGYVNNTSDLDKPISTATQTALNLKASQSSLDTTNEELNATKTRLQQVITAHDGLLEQHLDLVDVVDTKLDKKTNEFEGFSAVYGIDNYQENKLYKMSTFYDQYSVAIRDNNGNSSFATPSENYHAANKKYVDDIADTKVDKTTTVNGKPLSGNITLTAGELNAYTKTETDNLVKDKASSSEVSTLKSQVNSLNTQVGTNTTDINGLKSTVNNKVDKNLLINGHILSTQNITLTAEDVGALDKYTAYGASLDSSSSSIILKDQNGKNLDTLGSATQSLAGAMSSVDKTKLDGIEEGAEVNVQTDWNETDTTSPAYLKNKPDIPEGAVLYTDIGQNTDGSITQKKVTELIQNKLLGVADGLADGEAINVVLPNFVLTECAEIYVKFPNGVDFSRTYNLYMNVNGTGKKPIQIKSSADAYRYPYQGDDDIAQGGICRFVYSDYYMSAWYLKENIKTGRIYTTANSVSEPIHIARGGGAGSTYNGSYPLVLSDHYVDKYDAQTIAGVKNFTSTPTVNGVNVATVDDVSSDITVDNALSSTSENPVQNKVVNSALSNKLNLTGGNVSGHIYLTGAKASSSTGNTSQLVFGTSEDNHIAITSNKNALVLNPTTSSSSNQVVFYTNTTTTSKIPSPLNIGGTTTTPTLNATSAINVSASGTINLSGTTNATGAKLKWGTVNSNTPYIGYATDQNDGTFVIGSNKGTNYASGLAIGGGSGNLLWKGNKVATTADIPSAIKVDSALSTTSTNPVQNKVVTNKLSTKVNFTETSEATETANRLLDLIYPVGSIYLTVSGSDYSNFLGGTWVRVAQGRALFGAGDIEPNGSSPSSSSTTKISYTAGTNVNAGLPNITGAGLRGGQDGWSEGAFIEASIGQSNGAGGSYGANYSFNAAFGEVRTDGVRQNNVYGKSNTVQPNGYVIYVWRRNA